MEDYSIEKIITIYYEEYCEDSNMAIAILDHHRKELRQLHQTFTDEEQILKWLMTKNDAEQFTVLKRHDGEMKLRNKESHRTNRGKGTLIYH